MINLPMPQQVNPPQNINFPMHIFMGKLINIDINTMGKLIGYMGKLIKKEGKND